MKLTFIAEVTHFSDTSLQRKITTEVNLVEVTQFYDTSLQRKITTLCLSIVKVTQFSDTFFYKKNINFCCLCVICPCGTSPSDMLEVFRGVP